MKRIEWIDARLRGWALWRLSSSGGYRCIGFEYQERAYASLSAIEIDIETEREALEMDQAVAALPADLRDVVVAYYLWEGGMAVIEAKLRVTRATVHRRLCHADLRLLQWFDSRAQMRCQTNKNNYVSYTE